MDFDVPFSPSSCTRFNSGPKNSFFFITNSKSSVILPINGVQPDSSEQKVSFQFLLLTKPVETKYDRQIYGGTDRRRYMEKNMDSRVGGYSDYFHQ